MSSGKKSPTAAELAREAKRIAAISDDLFGSFRDNAEGPISSICDFLDGLVTNRLYPGYAQVRAAQEHLDHALILVKRLKRDLYMESARERGRLMDASTAARNKEKGKSKSQ